MCFTETKEKTEQNNKAEAQEQYKKQIGVKIQILNP